MIYSPNCVLIELHSWIPQYFQKIRPHALENSFPERKKENVTL